MHPCCLTQLARRLNSRESRAITATPKQLGSTKSEKNSSIKFEEANDNEPAPPPYTQDPRHLEADSKQIPIPPEYSSNTTNTTAYPAQAHHTQATTETLHIYYNRSLSSKLTITGSDKTTPLYHCETHYAHRPNVLITSAADSTQIGTGIIRCTSCTLDCTLGYPSEPFPVKPKGMLKSGYTFPNPLVAGSTAKSSSSWSWRNDSFWGLDVVCEDENGVTLARFSTENWSWKKCGRLEFTAAATERGQGETEKRRVIEAILTTGLTILEYKHQRNQGLAASAASTSSVSSVAVTA